MNSANPCSIEYVYQFEGNDLDEKCKLRDDLLDRGIIYANSSYRLENRYYEHPYILQTVDFSSGSMTLSIYLCILAATLIILIILIIIYLTAGDEGKSMLTIPLIISGVSVCIPILLLLGLWYKSWKFDKVVKETKLPFTDTGVIEKNINDAITRSSTLFNEDNTPQEKYLFRKAYLDNYMKTEKYDKAEQAALDALKK